MINEGVIKYFRKEMAEHKRRFPELSETGDIMKSYETEEN